MKKALITGITGQDGSFLAELLLAKGYEVYGLVRRTSNDPFARFDEKIRREIRVLYGNLRDASTVVEAVNESSPDEIYNLAAQSDVGVSFKCPDETMEINYHGLGRVVHAALDSGKDIRIYQASTSEMFGASMPPQNEGTEFKPVSPYGVSKLRAHEDYVKGYREKHGLRICSGILFNHESSRRGEHFVTRKITKSLAKISAGIQKDFELGNLDAKRDWGFAGDYVEAMWKMLQQDKPEDFVISTGVSHTVREFVQAAASAMGKTITWEGEGVNEVGRDENGNVIVRVNEKYYRPSEVNYLLGDSTKAKRVLGWIPKTSFNELVALMMEADLKRYGK